MRSALTYLFLAIFVAATAVADDFGTSLRHRLDAENKALITYHYSSEMQGKIGDQTPRFIYYYTIPKNVLAAQPTLSDLDKAKKPFSEIIRTVQERLTREAPGLEIDSISVNPTNDDRTRHYLLFFFRGKNSDAGGYYHSDRIIALWDGTILEPTRHELMAEDSYAIDMKGTLEPHQ